MIFLIKFHIILISLFLVVQINFNIFFADLFNSIRLAVIVGIYSILIGISEYYIKKMKVINKFFIYGTLAIILSILLMLLSNREIFNIFLKDVVICLILLIYYINLTNSKFNKLTTTFKNLKPSFYLFILSTASLFGFKYYLLVSKIKQPSFWYLFLTIPISGLVIYFYVKDLKPIFDKFVKESKKIKEETV